MIENKTIDFSKKEYLISDWDGTLVESFANILESFATVMKQQFKVRREDSIEFMTKTNGRPLSSQFVGATKQFAEIEIKDSTPYENAFWKLMEDKVPKPIDGAREFLEKTKNLGIHIAIWLGTRSDFLERQIIALGFDSLVEFWIGTASGTSAKNKAPLFYQILEFYKIPREELIRKSIVFGDGTGDIESGKKVGISTVGFANNGKNKEKLENSGADLLVDNYEELLECFK